MGYKVNRNRKSRITAEQALEWKRQYEEEGETIESLALDNRVSRGSMANYLKGVGTKMRPAGRQGNPSKIAATDGIKGSSEKTGAKKVISKGSFTGHRRRGRF